MQTESNINLTTYEDGNTTVKKTGILERNFSERTVKIIKTIGFVFQYVFMDIAFPLILYFTLKHPLGELYATIISSIPSLLSVIWSILIKRRFEPLPILIIFAFSIGLGLSLGLKDAKLHQINGPIITTVIGTSYIATVNFKRPVIYYFTRPWITKNELEKIREFDLKWENPYIINSMKVVSVVWGLGFILQSIANVVLIFTIDLDSVMIWGHVLTFGTIAILLVWSYIYKNFKTKQYQKQNQQDPTYRV
jgi:intracellular septation protein A